LGSHLVHPSEVQLLKVRFWERWPPVVREKEREKREATVGGLNTLGSASDRTLSRLAGLCLVRTLYPGRGCKLERIEE
jgi:hypothetical protein